MSEFLIFRAVVLCLHLAAIIVWIGGIFFTSTALFPVLGKAVSSSQEFASLVSKIGKRFQTISWEAVAVIVLTGIFNVINAGILRGFNYRPVYLGVLALKVVLVVLIVANQILHSFIFLPKLQAAAAGEDNTPRPSDEFIRLRKKTMLFSIHNLILATLVLLLGVLLGTL